MPGQIDVKWKGSKLIGCWASKCDLDHTHGFSWNSNISGMGGPIDIEQKGHGIMTFWWPWWGVRIYHIVIGMTSDVSVPLTRLVLGGVMLIQGGTHFKYDFSHKIQNIEKYYFFLIQFVLMQLLQNCAYIRRTEMCHLQKGNNNVISGNYSKLPENILIISGSFKIC